MEETEKQLNRNGNRRGMSPNSQKNLGKGRNGNNHANKDYSITRIIKEMLDKPAVERWLEVEDKGQRLTWRQAIAKRILIEAVRGNARVTNDLLDRLEGKVVQPIGGEDGGAIKVDIDAKGKLISILDRLASRAGEARGDTKPEPEGS